MAASVLKNMVLLAKSLTHRFVEYLHYISSLGRGLTRCLVCVTAGESNANTKVKDCWMSALSF